MAFAAGLAEGTEEEAEAEAEVEGGPGDVAERAKATRDDAYDAMMGMLNGGAGEITPSRGQVTTLSDE
eukprot:1153011-Prorocentrum_minimum.AAC.1